MRLNFGNNVRSVLAADITATQTTISVVPGGGALFAAMLEINPALVSSNAPVPCYAKVTLTDAQQTTFEICHLTAVSGDNLTVIRGQEDTTAKGWSLNDPISNFATRGSENTFVQIEDLQNGAYLSADAGGTANALAIELPSTFFINSSNTFHLRAPVLVTPKYTNTGACTLQLVVSGRVIGTQPLVKGDGLSLVTGDIVAGLPFLLIQASDKGYFQITSPTTGVLPDAVTSVNGKKGDVVLSAQDVGALPITGGTVTGQVTAPLFSSTPNVMPEGAGAYSAQLTSKASFYQQNWQWPVNAGGIFVPIGKGKSTRSTGWPTAISYGYIMPVEDVHACPVIQALGDGGMECIWEFNTKTGGIHSKAGLFLTEGWCPFPVGYFMLMGTNSNPNVLYPGTTWQDLNATGYDGRVISLGHDALGIGGNNSVTITANNLPDHSHKSGWGAPGSAYANDLRTGTDNTGKYNRTMTAETFTNSSGSTHVSNAPINVTNAYVHVRGWMRTA